MKKLIFLFAFVLIGQMSIQAHASSTSLLEDPPKTIKLKITGMTCAGCSNHISKALQGVDGIIEEEVKYPGDIAVIKFDSEKTNAKAIIKVIEDTGYKAELMKDEKTKDQP